MLRVVFMGTPDFAAGSLKALFDAGYSVLAAVSQPDKPVGRHGDLRPTAVKAEAMRLGIEVLQPESASDAGFMSRMHELNPDIIVVAAYGKLLKPELLGLPRYGCVNVHASLLPRWRGAAPIQWAILEGDPETGVSIMQMDEGLDTGDIISTERLAISPAETGGSLFDRLSVLGAGLLIKTLKSIEDGTAVRTTQPAEGMTYARMLTKEMGEINWEDDAARIERMVRGLSPWPGAYTYAGGKLLKIHEAKVFDDSSKTAGGSASEPGKVTAAGARMIVSCGRGALELLTVQPESKKRMTAAAYLNGRHPERLGRQHT